MTLILFLWPFVSIFLLIQYIIFNFMFHQLTKQRNCCESGKVSWFWNSCDFEFPWPIQTFQDLDFLFFLVNGFSKTNEMIYNMCKFFLHLRLFSLLHSKELIFLYESIFPSMSKIWSPFISNFQNVPHFFSRDVIPWKNHQDSIKRL